MAGRDSKGNLVLSNDSKSGVMYDIVIVYIQSGTLPYIRAYLHAPHGAAHDQHHLAHVQVFRHQTTVQLHRIAYLRYALHDHEALNNVI